MRQRGGMRVVVTARAKYKRFDEEAGKTAVVTTPRPKDLLDGTIATASLAAHVIRQKVGQGLPLHRLEDGFAREGVPLDRATMSRMLEELGATFGATVAARDATGRDGERLLHRDGRDGLQDPAPRRDDGKRAGVQERALPRPGRRPRPRLLRLPPARDQRGHRARRSRASAATSRRTPRASTTSSSGGSRPSADEEPRTPSARSRVLVPRAEEVLGGDRGREERGRARKASRGSAASSSSSDCGRACIRAERQQHARGAPAPARRGLLPLVRRAARAHAGARSAAHRAELRRPAEGRADALPRRRPPRARQQPLRARAPQGRRGPQGVALRRQRRARREPRPLFSLDASARLHGLDPEAYFRDLIRVLPFWPRERYLELCPRDWARTRALLDPAELAREVGTITVPPPLA